MGVTLGMGCPPLAGWCGRGVSHPVPTGGTHPVLLGVGGTPSSPDVGYPRDGVPPFTGSGTPLVSWMGYPLSARWRYFSHQLDVGTPPPPAISWMRANPSHSAMDGGTPPRPPGCEQTDRWLWKQYLPHSFIIRAVTKVAWTVTEPGFSWGGAK